MKLYQLFLYWSYKFRSWSVYYRIKDMIDSNEDYIRFSLRDRRIGKTYNLVKLSRKYNAPLVEPNDIMKSLVMREYKRFHPVVFCPRDYIDRKYKILLLDEGQLINQDYLNALKDRFRLKIVYSI